jgi:hypothetical protein
MAEKKLPGDNPNFRCLAHALTHCDETDPAAFRPWVCNGDWRMGYRTEGTGKDTILTKVDNGPDFIGNPTKQ